MRRVLVAALLLGLLAAPASAKTTKTTTTTTTTDPNALSRPARLDRPPIGRKLTGKQAISIALRDPTMAAARRKHRAGPITPFLKGATRWQVSLYDKSGKHEVAQASIDDGS